MTLKSRQYRLVKQYFSECPEVMAVYLYGSRATGRHGPLSDLDLAVLLDDAFLERDKTVDSYRLDYIELAMKIFGSDEVDVQVISRETSLAFAYNVIAEGQRLFSKTDEKVLSLETSIVSKYLDYLPVLEQMYQAMHQRLQKGSYGVTEN